jgi:flagellar hook-associated protein 2
MTSNTSSTSSTTATTTSSSRRYTGMISGLDVDTLVKNLSKGTQTKIDRLVQKKQLTAWRQESYREVITALQEFQDKYFKTSSSNCISNSDFFQTTSIANTSSYLNVSGNSTNASKMVITGISQLAVQANFTSSHKVSNETVSSLAAVSDYYTKSSVASNSITINYGGTDYTITLDNDFLLNDADSAETNIINVVDELNREISANSSLSGKISFSYDNTGNKVTVSSTDKDFYIKSGSSSLLSGLGLSTSKTGATSVTGDTTQAKNFFNSTLAAGSYLDITVDGTAYTLEIASDVALSANDTAETLSSTLQTALQTAIDNNSDLKGKVTASVTTDEDNNIKVTFSAATGTMAVTGGSKNMLNGLGLSVNATESASVSGTASRDELVKTDLGIALSGSTMTFNLDGISKSITFNESERSQYSTVEGLKTYLQTKLKNIYGADTIDVSVNYVSANSGILSFKTKNSTSIFSVSSCDNSGILGPEGVLHIYAGESNRLNTNKTLEDLASNWNTSLTAGTDGTYGITINGKSFTFKATDTLAKVISTINSDSDANVTISYSNTLDTFSITADSGGANSKVEISSDAGSGNLAEVLFGKQSSTPATAATVTYDFSGKVPSDLDNKTITLNGVTYEFTTDGKLSDVSHVAIDISSVTSSTGIASAFSAAANLAGYKDTVNNSIVTFTATTTGVKTEPTISGDIIGSFTNGTNQDADYTVTAGQDAILTISFDGNASNATTITRSENKFTLDEVNFELLKADSTGSTVNEDNPITFTQKSEVDDLYKKLSSFIDDYNAIIKLISGKTHESTKTNGTTYEPLTDDQKSQMSESEITKWETNAKKGILRSDSLLTSLNDNLRDAMANAVSAVKSSLVAIGIDEGDYDEYGKLNISESTLKDALTNNPDTVKALFTDSEDGIAKRLSDILKANINTSIGNDGLLIQKAGISSRNYDNSTLAEEIDNYTTKIKELKEQLADEQDRYYNKFTALETYMNTMNAQLSLFMSPSSSSY